MMADKALEIKNDGIKTGLIGFFDILGYQNLLEKNEPEKIAENVIPILTSINEEVIKKVNELTQVVKSGDFKKRNKELLNKLHWLIFSDTVLLSLAIEEQDKEIECWAIFFATAMALQKKLFNAGLPVRGAIDYGRFLIKKNCFAGHPIVSAYKLSSKIEFAACVLCKSAFEKLKELKEFSELKDLFIINYFAPMKDINCFAPIKEKKERMWVVRAHTYEIDRPEINTAVMNSFRAHDKDIPRNVRLKAQNTEQWLEFLKNKRKKKI